MYLQVGYILSDKIYVKTVNFFPFATIFTVMQDVQSYLVE